MLLQLAMARGRLVCVASIKKFYVHGYESLLSSARERKREIAGGPVSRVFFC